MPGTILHNGTYIVLETHLRKKNPAHASRGCSRFYCGVSFGEKSFSWIGTNSSGRNIIRISQLSVGTLTNHLHRRATKTRLTSTGKFLLRRLFLHSGKLKLCNYPGENYGLPREWNGKYLPTDFGTASVGPISLSFLPSLCTRNPLTLNIPGIRTCPRNTASVFCAIFHLDFVLRSCRLPMWSCEI